MKKSYSDQEISDLLNEVETAFSEHLAKAEQSIEKKEEVTEELEKKEEVEKEPETIDELYNSMSKAEKEEHLESLKKSLNIVDEEKIEKSEVIVEEKIEDMIKKSEYDDLQKKYNDLTESVKKFIETSKKQPPKRKAFTTEIEFIKKNENLETKEELKEDFSKLSKSEIVKRLAKKVREGKLEKKDRDIINNYCLSDAKFETIKHLL